MPIILFMDVWILKKIYPVTTTNIGVREFNVPASPLSIFSSAMQNKKAGNKLPMLPDMNIKNSLLEGTLFMYFIVIGNNTSPAEKMRNAATW